MELLNQIKIDLQEEKRVEREEPFTIRKINPYLNKKWIGNAVSYGCYRKGQAPGENGPSKEEILEDLKIISEHWNLIRVYGSDNDAENILEVIKENDLPIKVMLGIWLENETDKPERKAENIEQVLYGIKLANKYKDILFAVNVGNETQVFWSWHKMKIDKLIFYIQYLRYYTEVPVTSADDYNFWNKHESQSVAKEIDFIVTHIYSLWNGKQLDDSITWLDSVYFNDIKPKHPDKEIVIGETGWATDYNKEKSGDGEQGSLIKAEVGLEAQEKYLIMHNQWVNKKKVITFLFEAFDEPWKGGGETSPENEVEKHWGVFYENRTPKESFTNYLKK